MILNGFGIRRVLRSFPTRRSSDLYGAGQAPAADALRLREALLPYTYTLARQAVATGIPMVRAMYLDHPDLDAAYKDRKSTRLNSSHRCISYAVFCLKKIN